MAQEEPTYQPKDAIANALKATMITSGAGAFVSAIQNTLTKQNVTAWGVITRSGGTIAVFAAMGGAYTFASLAFANLRGKKDSWNPTIGGFVAGSVVGMRFRTLPAVLGYGAGLAVLLGTFDYTGAAFSGYKKNPDIDEFDRKQHLRKLRRRPIEQTG